MALLEFADVRFENGQPFHNGYQDIYYNPANGIAETEHVFIAGNNLRARFANTIGDFVIGEVGFGSGLNFLHTADVFLQIAPPAARLHFISFENNPLPREILATLHKTPLITPLLLHYPDNNTGHHLLKIHPRIDLHLLWGDICDTLPQLTATVEAWFLDGFAPAKNPACWSENLLQEIAAHSKKNATAATFSAARVVRDSLMKAGFVVEKCRGFGRKRDMIRAVLKTPSAPRPHWRNQPAATTGKIAIIGGGIAAATTARALAKSGREVVIFSAENHLPASFVPVAVPYLQPDRKPSPILDYQLNTWHHAMRALAEYIDPIGVERIPLNALEITRHQELIAANLMNKKEYFLDDQGHLHYPRAGVIYLPSLLEALKNHHNITMISREIKTLDELKDFSAKILCTGWQSTLNPEPLLQNAIRPLRGQGTIFQTSAILERIICDSRTLIPIKGEKIYSGASFDPNSSDLMAREKDNLDNAEAIYQRLGENISLTPTEHFVGIRGAARDYLPLVGAIPCGESIVRAYEQYRYNARAEIAADIKFYDGLYQHQALGSKGCTFSWLNAELLTAMINATPLPLPTPQQEIIAPARFFIRALKRNQFN